MNVIVTNWDSYSFFNGTFVVNRTVPLLAKICIKLINQFIQAGSTAQQMYVIGFSAGGQTAGFIGKGIKNLGRILGRLVGSGEIPFHDFPHYFLVTLEFIRCTCTTLQV